MVLFMDVKLPKASLFKKVKTLLTYSMILTFSSGDIHKQQKMTSKGRVRYAGSTIQQTLENQQQFLMWNIRDKYDWELSMFQLLTHVLLLL